MTLEIKEIKSNRKFFKRKPRKKAARKKVKKKTLSQLKKALEAAQKAKTIEIHGNDCYTCPQKNLQGMNCQLGHVPWPRSVLAVQLRYDTRFTRIQCFRCNINHGGNGAIAYARMLKEGVDLESMWAENEKLKGISVPNSWFEEKITQYSELENNF